uniref:Uncharacterized protein n=1 Tax=Oryza barthii TaxID=65489 RepID=A0A0D3EZR5_9ORYZ
MSVTSTVHSLCQSFHSCSICWPSSSKQHPRLSRQKNPSHQNYVQSTVVAEVVDHRGVSPSRRGSRVLHEGAESCTTTVMSR